MGILWAHTGAIGCIVLTYSIESCMSDITTGCVEFTGFWLLIYLCVERLLNQ